MKSPLFSTTLASLAALLLIAGCRTAHQFGAPDSRWTSYSGQLHHVSSQGSKIGDVVVSTHAGRELQLEFLGGPAFPLLQLRADGEKGRAEGVFARAGWEGAIEQAPAQLRSWFALREVFYTAERQAIRSGRHNFNGRGWQAAAQFDAGKVTTLTVRFSTGEEFLFHFSR